MLRADRVPVAPAPGSPGKVYLTPREAEVMHWIMEGKRDREIAVILGLSPRTVEKHVCHILEKLQVETRTAAANECRELIKRALENSKSETNRRDNSKPGINIH
jgi:DNA-binding CsgD family transcriptional regulator